MDYQIEMRRQQNHDIAAVKFRAKVTEMPQYMSKAFGDVLSYLVNVGVQPQGPAVSLYEQLSEDDFNVTAGFLVSAPVSGDGNVVPAELPEAEVVTTTHVGPYEGLPQAYEALQAWMRQQGKEPATNLMWEEYVTGPETPSEQTRTIIYWPVKSR